MVDCFHPLPCDQALLACSGHFLVEPGYPFHQRASPEGSWSWKIWTMLGWVCFSLDQIRLVLQNFAATNFSHG